MRSRGALTALAVALGIYLVFGVAVRLRVSSSAPAPARALRGALHVHTDRSHDGRGALDEVAAAARSAGLQFLVLADHNVAPPGPMYLDGVLIVPGAELSTPHGHLVALGGWDGGSQRTVSGIHVAGARAVLAHPVQKKRPWTGWDAETGWDGLEVVSFDSLWRSALSSPLRVVAGALAYPWAPVRALAELWASEPGALGRWDRELARRPVAGLCSADAHGLPDYEAVFALFSTYLDAELSGDASSDAAQVTEALFTGRSWCALSALSPAPLFRLDVAPDGFRVAGAEAGQTVLLYCDGMEVARAPAAKEVRFAPHGGACRVEVRALLPGLLFGAREVTWIYSGAVRVPE